MKPGIHPAYGPVVFRDKAADFAFLTRSTATSDKTVEWEDGRTYPVIDVEISSQSHPFYTGTARVLDTMRPRRALPAPLREQAVTLPVVIVGGLHGDARRAAVRELLATVPRSVALHHDLSTAAGGTVRRLVRDASGELSRSEAPLVNDCACCALREDLVPELWRLAADGTTRLAVVELWDSVEPRAMAEVVAAHGGDALELTNVITAVDPALVLPCLANGDDLADAGLAAAATDQRTVGDTWARQLEYAPVLALVDGADADDEDRALLAQLHPTARRVETGTGELARIAFAGFDTEAAAAAQHPACALLPQEADEAGVATLVWHRRLSLPPGAALPGPGGPRLRGRPQPRPILARRPPRHPAVLGRRGRRALRGEQRPVAGLTAGRRLGVGASRPQGGRRPGLASRARRLLPAPGLHLTRPRPRRPGATARLVPADRCRIRSRAGGVEAPADRLRRPPRPRLVTLTPALSPRPCLCP